VSITAATTGVFSIQHHWEDVADCPAGAYSGAALNSSFQRHWPDFDVCGDVLYGAFVSL
jgi:hypothetical protein